MGLRRSAKAPFCLQPPWVMHMSVRPIRDWGRKGGATASRGVSLSWRTRGLLRVCGTLVQDRLVELGTSDRCPAEGISADACMVRSACGRRLDLASHFWLIFGIWLFLSWIVVFTYLERRRRRTKSP